MCKNTLFCQKRWFDDEIDDSIEKFELTFEDAIFKLFPDEPKQVRGPLKRAPYLRYRDKAIFYLLLGTGMRVSELVGIDIGDLKLEMNRINIVRKGGKYDHVYLKHPPFNIFAANGIFINRGCMLDII